MREASNILHLDTLTDVECWYKQLTWFASSRDLPFIACHLAEFSKAENVRLTSLANQHRRNCACSLSGFLMTLTLIALATAFFVRGGRWSDLTWGHGGVLVSAMLVATLCGKAVGFFWSRSRLRRLARQVVRDVQSAQQTTNSTKFMRTDAVNQFATILQQE